jgi:hypothetical protein
MFSSRVLLCCSDVEGCDCGVLGVFVRIPVRTWSFIALWVVRFGSVVPGHVDKDIPALRSLAHYSLLPLISPRPMITAAINSKFYAPSFCFYSWWWLPMMLTVMVNNHTGETNNPYTLCLKSPPAATPSHRPVCCNYPWCCQHRSIENQVHMHQKLNCR